MSTLLPPYQPRIVPIASSVLSVSWPMQTVCLGDIKRFPMAEDWLIVDVFLRGYVLYKWVRYTWWIVQFALVLYPLLPRVTQIWLDTFWFCTFLPNRSHYPWMCICCVHPLLVYMMMLFLPFSAGLFLYICRLSNPVLAFWSCISWMISKYVTFQ